MSRRAIIAVSVLCLLGIAVGLWIVTGANPELQYVQEEIPAMRTAVAQISGVTIRGVYEYDHRGEFSPLVVLDVADHGTLVLHRPTRTSFSGGGYITIVGIGECRQTIPLYLSDASRRLGLPTYGSIADVIAHYDELLQQARASGMCQTADWRAGTRPLWEQP